jgi:hypothetical protein
MAVTLTAAGKQQETMVQSRCRTTERIEITKTTKKEICITRRRQGSIMKNKDAERTLKKETMSN